MVAAAARATMGETKGTVNKVKISSQWDTATVLELVEEAEEVEAVVEVKIGEIGNECSDLTNIKTLWKCHAD